MKAAPCHHEGPDRDEEAEERGPEREQPETTSTGHRKLRAWGKEHRSLETLRKARTWTLLGAPGGSQPCPPRTVPGETREGLTVT